MHRRLRTQPLAVPAVARKREGCQRRASALERLSVVEIFLLPRSSPGRTSCSCPCTPISRPIAPRTCRARRSGSTASAGTPGLKGRTGEESADCEACASRLTDGLKTRSGRMRRGRGRTVTRPRVVEGIAAGRRLRLVRGHGRRHPRRTARRPVPLETFPPLEWRRCRLSSRLTETQLLHFGKLIARSFGMRRFHWSRRE